VKARRNGRVAIWWDWTYSQARLAEFERIVELVGELADGG